MSFQKQTIPWMMAAARAGLGPVLVVGQRCSWNGLAMAGIVLAALLSDIFDGVLARRWQCDTAGVRLFDSMADTVFYLGTAVALWIGQPEIWRSQGELLGVLLGLEAVRFAFDFAKFGKPASYHSWLAKSWGLVLAVAVIGCFALGRPSVLVPVALGLGIVCNLEGLAMSIVLPVWRKDVKTLAVAWRLREGKSPRLAVSSGAVAGLVLVCSLSVAGFAGEPGTAVYSGWSSRRVRRTRVQTTRSSCPSAASKIFRRVRSMRTSWGFCR
jgi:CDP-diacylglycerol--glycerol-3-phosphate 3-phosphatidyltransferase